MPQTGEHAQPNSTESAFDRAPVALSASPGHPAEPSASEFGVHLSQIAAVGRARLGPKVRVFRVRPVAVRQLMILNGFAHLASVCAVEVVGLCRLGDRSAAQVAKDFDLTGTAPGLSPSGPGRRR